MLSLSACLLVFLGVLGIGARAEEGDVIATGTANMSQWQSASSQRFTQSSQSSSSNMYMSESVFGDGTSDRGFNLPVMEQTTDVGAGELAAISQGQDGGRLKKMGEEGQDLPLTVETKPENVNKSLVVPPPADIEKADKPPKQAESSAGAESKKIAVAGGETTTAASAPATAGPPPPDPVAEATPGTTAPEAPPTTTNAPEAVTGAPGTHMGRGMIYETTEKQPENSEPASGAESSNSDMAGGEKTASENVSTSQPSPDASPDETRTSVPNDAATSGAPADNSPTGNEEDLKDGIAAADMASSAPPESAADGGEPAAAPEEVPFPPGGPKPGSEQMGRGLRMSQLIKESTDETPDEPEPSPSAGAKATDTEGAGEGKIKPLADDGTDSSGSSPPAAVTETEDATPAPEEFPSNSTSDDSVPGNATGQTGRGLLDLNLNLFGGRGRQQRRRRPTYQKVRAYSEDDDDDRRSEERRPRKKPKESKPTGTRAPALTINYDICKSGTKPEPVKRVYHYSFKTASGETRFYNETHIFPLRPVYYVLWFQPSTYGAVQFIRVRKYVLPPPTKFGKAAEGKATFPPGQNPPLRFYRATSAVPSDPPACDVIEVGKLASFNFNQRFAYTHMYGKSFVTWIQAQNGSMSPGTADALQDELKDYWVRAFNTKRDDNKLWKNVRAAEDAEEATKQEISSIKEGKEPDTSKPPHMPDGGQFIAINDVYSEGEGAPNTEGTQGGTREATVSNTSAESATTTKAVTSTSTSTSVPATERTQLPATTTTVETKPETVDVITPAATETVAVAVAPTEQSEPSTNSTASAAKEVTSEAEVTDTNELSSNASASVVSTEPSARASDETVTETATPDAGVAGTENFLPASTTAAGGTAGGDGSSPQPEASPITADTAEEASSPAGTEAAIPTGGGVEVTTNNAVGDDSSPAPTASVPKESVSDAKINDPTPAQVASEPPSVESTSQSAAAAGDASSATVEVPADTQPSTDGGASSSPPEASVAIEPITQAPAPAAEATESSPVPQANVGDQTTESTPTQESATTEQTSSTMMKPINLLVLADASEKPVIESTQRSESGPGTGDGVYSNGTDVSSSSPNPVPVQESGATAGLRRFLAQLLRLAATRAAAKKKSMATAVAVATLSPKSLKAGRPKAVQKEFQEKKKTHKKVVTHPNVGTAALLGWSINKSNLPQSSRKRASKAMARQRVGDSDKYFFYGYGHGTDDHYEPYDYYDYGPRDNYEDYDPYAYYDYYWDPEPRADYDYDRDYGGYGVPAPQRENVQPYAPPSGGSGIDSSAVLKGMYIKLKSDGAGDKARTAKGTKAKKRASPKPHSTAPRPDARATRAQKPRSIARSDES